jgi:hypothetical protein
MADGSYYKDDADERYRKLASPLVSLAGLPPSGSLR